MSKISLAGLNKAVVLAALYNASKPKFIGFIRYNPKPMTREEADGLLRQTFHFTYLKGRVMEVDLSGDELDTRGYDRDNGQGAAECVIAELRLTGDVNSPKIKETHRVNTLKEANNVRTILGDDDELPKALRSNRIWYLDIQSVRDVLGQAVGKAVNKLQV